MSFLRRLMGRDDRDAMDIWAADREPAPSPSPSPSPGQGEVLLVDTGPHLIPVIKAVRGATGLGLKEAKQLVDSAPVTVMTDRPEQLVAELAQAGATAQLQAPGTAEAITPAAATSGGGSVHLLDAGENKIQVIKAVRKATGLGLREAKDLVDSAPVVLASGLDGAAAAAFKRELEAAGAEVS